MIMEIIIIVAYAEIAYIKVSSQQNVLDVIQGYIIMAIMFIAPSVAI